MSYLQFYSFRRWLYRLSFWGEGCFFSRHWFVALTCLLALSIGFILNLLCRCASWFCTLAPILSTANHDIKLYLFDIIRYTKVSLSISIEHRYLRENNVWSRVWQRQSGDVWRKQPRLLMEYGSKLAHEKEVSQRQNLTLKLLKQSYTHRA